MTKTIICIWWRGPEQENGLSCRKWTSRKSSWICCSLLSKNLQSSKYLAAEYPYHTRYYHASIAVCCHPLILFMQKTICSLFVLSRSTFLTLLYIYMYPPPPRKKINGGIFHMVRKGEYLDLLSFDLIAWIYRTHVLYILHRTNPPHTHTHTHPSPFVTCQDFSKRNKIHHNQTLSWTNYFRGQVFF